MASILSIILYFKLETPQCKYHSEPYFNDVDVTHLYSYHYKHSGRFFSHKLVPHANGEHIGHKRRCLNTFSEMHLQRVFGPNLTRQASRKALSSKQNLSVIMKALSQTLSLATALFKRNLSLKLQKATFNFKHKNCLDSRVNAYWIFNSQTLISFGSLYIIHNVVIHVGNVL